MAVLLSLLEDNKAKHQPAAVDAKAQRICLEIIFQERFHFSFLRNVYGSR